MKKFTVALIISLLFGNIAFAEVKSSESQQVKYKTGNYDFKMNSAGSKKQNQNLSDKNIKVQKNIVNKVKSDENVTKKNNNKQKKSFFKFINNKKKKENAQMPVQFQIIEMDVIPEQTRTIEKL